MLFRSRTTTKSWSPLDGVDRCGCKADPGSGIWDLCPCTLIPRSLARNLKRWVSGVLQKLIQQPKPWGGDPGAALMGRGWTGRGRGSSPARAAGRDPAEGLRGEAVVQPGAPGSCGRRGPWIPPHSKVKAHAARHQLSPVGAEFSKASVGREGGGRVLLRKLGGGGGPRTRPPG